MNQIERTIGAIASGIFLIAGLMYFGSMSTIFFYVGGMQRQQNEWANPKDPFKSRKLKISEHRAEDGKRFKPGYLEMAKFDDIKGGRRVYFTSYVRVSDLLRPGEAPPTNELKQVFAGSRAILYAQAECERLLETLARECEVSRADGRMDEGDVRIEAYLDFVQREEFGDPDASAEWVFAATSSKLNEKAVPTSLAGGAAARAQLYRKAALNCAEIKRREGNCAITSVRAYMSRYRGAVTLDGSAEYAFLMRKAN